MRLLLVGILIGTIQPNSGLAQGGNDGGQVGGNGWGGDGWDGTFPPSIEREAELLRKDFQGQDLQDLLDQQILGTLCSNSACGGISEGQASQILERIVEQSKSWEPTWVARLGALFGFFSLLISYLAYRQSAVNEREIGAMQERMAPVEGGPK